MGAHFPLLSFPSFPLLSSLPIYHVTFRLHLLPGRRLSVNLACCCPTDVPLSAHISTLNPIFAGGGGDADSVRAGADTRRVRRQGQGGRPQEDQGRARLLSEQVLKDSSEPKVRTSNGMFDYGKRTINHVFA